MFFVGNPGNSYSVVNPRLTSEVNYLKSGRVNRLDSFYGSVHELIYDDTIIQIRRIVLQF